MSKNVKSQKMSKKCQKMSKKVKSQKMSKVKKCQKKIIDDLIYIIY